MCIDLPLTNWSAVEQTSFRTTPAKWVSTSSTTGGGRSDILAADEHATVEATQATELERIGGALHESWQVGEEKPASNATNTNYTNMPNNEPAQDVSAKNVAEPSEDTDILAASLPGGESNEDAQEVHLQRAGRTTEQCEDTTPAARHQNKTAQSQENEGLHQHVMCLRTTLLSVVIGVTVVACFLLFTCSQQMGLACCELEDQDRTDSEYLADEMKHAQPAPKKASPDPPKSKFQNQIPYSVGSSAVRSNIDSSFVPLTGEIESPSIKNTPEFGSI
ncbi:unnamed protein product [Amoebophrya sp. A120]|nr:unnamed protein product [Amoebophrya sp. A120]|eukprot:GSA120T00021599001.1